MNRPKSSSLRTAFVFAALMVGAPLSHAEGRRFAFSDDNVPGWALMSSAERAAHHQKLMAMHSLEECRVRRPRFFWTRNLGVKPCQEKGAWNAE
jgi:hypothetical protein